VKANKPLVGFLRLLFAVETPSPAQKPIAQVNNRPLSGRRRNYVF